MYSDKVYYSLYFKTNKVVSRFRTKINRIN